MDFLTLLSVTSSLPALAVLVLSKIPKDKTYVTELRLLLIAFLVVDITLLILANYGINNLLFFHLITFIEFGLLSIIYIKNYTAERAKWMRYMAFLTIAFLVVNSVFLEHHTEFNSNARIVESIILIIFAITWLIEVSKKPKYDSITQNPVLYLTAGVLVYFAGNAYLFAYEKSLTEKYPELAYRLWDIHSILNVFFNVMLAWMAWKMRKPIQRVEFNGQNKMG